MATQAAVDGGAPGQLAKMGSFRGIPLRERGRGQTVFEDVERAVLGPIADTELGCNRNYTIGGYFLWGGAVGGTTRIVEGNTVCGVIVSVRGKGKERPGAAGPKWPA